MPHTTLSEPATRPLTRRFLLIGVTGLTLLAISLACLLSHLLQDRLLSRDADLSRDFVQSVAHTQGLWPALRRQEPLKEAAFLEFLAHVSAMPDVLRANVYGADRGVLWSSRAELIGQHFGHNPELEHALAGSTVSHWAEEHSDKAEHWLLSAPRSGFVENYLPLLDPDSRRVVAVVELYRQPVSLIEVLQEGEQRLWWGCLGGALVLCLILASFVWHLESELNRRQRQLIDAQALAVVGELAAAIAHNIRNPLSSLRSAAELQQALGDDALMSPHAVIQQVDRVESLVRALLAQARPDDGLQARCGLRQVLVDVARMAQAQASDLGMRLQAEWPTDLGEVALPAELLAQVLHALLTNAMQASQPGQLIRLQAQQHSTGVEIQIIDDGCGLPAIHRERLGQAFFTTKASGLGLGLSLTRRALQRVGGTLTLQARHPTGTRVTVTLPILNNHAEPELMLAAAP